jgi:hypothetical protein
MTEQDAFVVWFNQGAIEMFESIKPVIRRNAKLHILLGAIWGGMSFLVGWAMNASVGEFDLLSTLLIMTILLPVPVTLIVFGVRRLRRFAEFNPVALTIIGDRVIFEDREFPGVWPIVFRGANWDRKEVTWKIRPATTLQPEMIIFRNTTKRARKQGFATSLVDMPVEEIIAALEAP